MDFREFKGLPQLLKGGSSKSTTKHFRGLFKTPGVVIRFVIVPDEKINLY